jgi:hypothetical protein
MEANGNVNSWMALSNCTATVRFLSPKMVFVSFSINRQTILPFLTLY